MVRPGKAKERADAVVTADDDGRNEESTISCVSPADCTMGGATHWQPHLHASWIRARAFGFTLTHDGVSEEIVLRYVCLTEDCFRDLRAELFECCNSGDVLQGASPDEENTLRAIIASKGVFADAWDIFVELCFST